MGVVVGAGSWGRRLEADEHGLRIRSPADPFVAAMARTTNRRRRLHLAVRALGRDDFCIEANVEVASHCRDDERRLAYLFVAVDAGELVWGGQGWVTDLCDEPGAMPWLRAVNALGDASAEIGDMDTAFECYARLIKLRPDDPFGARFKLECLPIEPAP